MNANKVLIFFVRKQVQIVILIYLLKLESTTLVGICELIHDLYITYIIW